MASVRKEGKGRGFYIPGVHLAISGDYSVVTTGEAERFQYLWDRERVRDVSVTLLCTGQPSTTKNYLDRMSTVPL